MQIFRKNLSKGVSKMEAKKTANKQRKATTAKAKSETKCCK